MCLFGGGPFKISVVFQTVSVRKIVRLRKCSVRKSSSLRNIGSTKNVSSEIRRSENILSDMFRSKNDMYFRECSARKACFQNAPFEKQWVFGNVSFK